MITNRKQINVEVKKEGRTNKYQMISIKTRSIDNTVQHNVRYRTVRCEDVRTCIVTHSNGCDDLTGVSPVIGRREEKRDERRDGVSER